MIPKELIQDNLARCLEDTSFLGWPGLKKGKVRDVYDFGERLILVTTDRLSAFDRILTCVPFKGQVLNQVSAFWFEATRDLVTNHILDIRTPTRPWPGSVVRSR